MTAEISNLTDSTFDAVITTELRPVIVDFWAEWCAPCKIIAPVLQKIADGNPEKLRVVKLNIDENPGITARFSVLSVPRLLIFLNGKQVKEFVGSRPKRQLLRELAEYL